VKKKRPTVSGRAFFVSWMRARGWPSRAHRGHRYGVTSSTTSSNGMQSLEDQALT